MAPNASAWHTRGQRVESQKRRLPTVSQPLTSGSALDFLCPRHLQVATNTIGAMLFLTPYNIPAVMMAMHGNGWAKPSRTSPTSTTNSAERANDDHAAPAPKYPTHPATQPASAPTATHTSRHTKAVAGARPPRSPCHPTSPLKSAGWRGPAGSSDASPGKPLLQATRHPSSASFRRERSCTSKLQPFCNPKWPHGAVRGPTTRTANR